MSDRATAILALDRLQGSEKGSKCGKEPDLHGKLTAHGDGNVLLCPLCGFIVPVSGEMVAEGLELGVWKPRVVREGR